MSSFYIGNYTNHGVYYLDENLCFLASSDDFCNPSYLCKTNDLVYCITETFPAHLVCYRNIGASLKCIDSMLIGFDGPCFITIDTFRNILYIACYANRFFSCFWAKRKWNDW